MKKLEDVIYIYENYFFIFTFVLGVKLILLNSIKKLNSILWLKLYKKVKKCASTFFSFFMFINNNYFYYSSNNTPSSTSVI